MLQILFPQVSLAFLPRLLYFWLCWFPWRRLALPPAWHQELTSVASLSLRRSCSSSLGLLLLLPPSILKIAAPAANLRPPASLSLSRQAHFLRSLVIAASLSSLRHFPSLRFPPHSAVFLPLSPYRSPLPAFPPLYPSNASSFCTSI